MTEKVYIIAIIAIAIAAGIVALVKQGRVK
jgi:hypothetical protein